MTDILQATYLPPLLQLWLTAPGGSHQSSVLIALRLPTIPV